MQAVNRSACLSRDSGFRLCSVVVHVLVYCFLFSVDSATVWGNLNLKSEYFSAFLIDCIMLLTVNIWVKHYSMY